MRRKLELDLQALLQEHEEVQTELRGATERAKKAGGEVSTRTRLGTEDALTHTRRHTSGPVCVCRELVSVEIIVFLK